MINELGRVIELLLSGKFICKTSYDDAWHLLQEPGKTQLVEQYLNQLNRTLSTAAEGEVYFAAYQYLGDDERKVLNHQFQEISSSLMPVVEWLLLVQEASGNDVPLTQGSAIRLNELQSTIEDTPAFAEQLAKISHYRLFNSMSPALDAQLKLVFKRLTEIGYLIKPNAEKAIYLATGKIDYIYEVLKFIDETEALSLTVQAEDAMKQGSLL